ncbi:MAG: cyclic-di-AMP receptor [Clostridia bacterium]|nr:cyclic-di-AMP receptor [Clostridia bacterium]
MKLIIAIVQDEDASRLVSNLMKDGFSVTKLATTGGFLRAGNTTLLLGVEDDKIRAAMDIIEHVCKSRRQMTTAPSTMPGVAGSYAAGSYPVEVTVGGATVFVLSVDQFVKL